MTKKRQNIDGFVPRRAGQQLGDLHSSPSRPTSQSSTPVRTRSEIRSGSVTQTTIGNRPGASLSRDEINQSLRSIDEPPKEKRNRKARRRARNAKAELHPRRKIIKRIIISLLIIGVVVGGFIGIRAMLAAFQVSNGNLLGLLQSKPLKTDENGRSNVVVFGTAEDSEGGMHEGGNLTDSMMVLSVDQKKKDAYMISIPRDLWVEYETTCSVGDAGKINAVYLCGSDDVTNEAAGAEAVQRKVGEVLGLDIQYYAHVNFSVVVDAVDAVGGVDITVESEDPRGILDRNFDWKCNYKCYYVNYKNGERVTMDGERALAFSRARNASGGYGLPNGNFDREKNQQKVIKALREKAVSAGTLTNFGKVNALIGSLGDNLRTNFDTSELRTLASLGEDVRSESIQSISLVDEEAPVLTTGMLYGQSIVQPLAGLLDYSELQMYIKEHLSNNPITREKAKLAVLNGSQVPGVAQTEADLLDEEGFVINMIENAPAGQYDAVEIYQIEEGNPATKAKLQEVFGVTVKQTVPPALAYDNTSFVIVFGAPRSSNAP